MILRSLTLLLIFTLCSTARPQNFDRLAELSTQAAEDLRAERLPELEAQQQRMQQTLAQVEAYLRQTSSPAVREGWLQYLLAEELRSALQANDPARLVDVGGRLADRLRAPYPGLERRPLQQLRSAAQSLSDAAEYRDPDQVIRGIERQLQILSQLFDRMEEIPTALDAAAAGRIVSILHRTGQAPQLIERVRATFDESNLQIHASEAFINDAVGRTVFEQQPVRQALLGTQIRGTSWLRGYVGADVVPSAQGAAIRLVLNADFHSNTTGFNRRVRIDTVSSAPVTAAKTLIINHEGIDQSATHVTGRINTTLCSVDHPLGIVRRIARRQAQEQQPVAERIATRRLHSELAESFDARLDASLDDNAAQAFQRTGTYFERLGLPEPEQRWSSDSQFVHVSLRQWDQGQLAAIRQPPTVPRNSYLTVQMHESALDNVAASVISGRKMDNHQLREMLVAAGIPEYRLESDQGEDGEDALNARTEITFADFRPVVFEARDNHIRFGLRGTQFSDGEREINRPLEIAATYVPEQRDGFTVLSRQGEVSVDFPGLQRLGVTEIALRRSIQRRFGKLFPPTMFDEPIVLPPSVPGDRSLRVTDLTAREGWLTIQFR